MIGACVLMLGCSVDGDPRAAKVRWQVAYRNHERDALEGLNVQTESGIRAATRLRNADHPHWSPRGRFLLFRTTGPSAANLRGLYLTDTPNRRTRRLTRYDPSAVAWSSDGRRIAYALECVGPTGSCEGQIHVVARAGGPPRLVYRTERSEDTLTSIVVTELAWAPDGTQLAFVSEPWDSAGRCETCSSTLQVLGLNGQGARTIATSEPGGLLAVPAWSPDGTLIAYGQRCYTIAFGDSYCDVAVITPQGTNARTLVSQERSGPTPSANIPFVWRPRTRELAFAGWGQGVEIGVVNAVTGKLRTFRGRAAFDLAFSSDGRRLGYITQALRPAGTPRPYEVHVADIRDGHVIVRHRLATVGRNDDLRLP